MIETSNQIGTADSSADTPCCANDIELYVLTKKRYPKDWFGMAVASESLQSAIEAFNKEIISRTGCKKSGVISREDRLYVVFYESKAITNEQVVHCLSGVEGAVISDITIGTCYDEIGNVLNNVICDVIGDSVFFKDIHGCHVEIYALMEYCFSFEVLISNIPINDARVVA